MSIILRTLKTDVSAQSREILNRLDRFLRDNVARLCRPQGFDDAIFADLHGVELYRMFIPAAYGGCYQNESTALAAARLISYHSVELGLAVGLTASLFLMPLGRHGSQELQAVVFPDFLKRGCVAGMLATEPGFGTDMTGIQTCFELQEDGNYRIRGLKHWQGLSGRAEYWLLMARQRKPGREELTRDIDFFVLDVPMKGFDFEEKYPSTGLVGIPYGRTRIDVTVPPLRKVSGAKSNLRGFYDIMHRCRTCVTSLAAGMCDRLAEEIDIYVEKRNVFGKPLSQYDQARYRVKEIQACAVVCDWLARYAGDRLEQDQSGLFDGFFANAVKALSTDLMQSAAYSAVQLRGGEGYRRDTYIGRSFVDCRPFQIFEGSNDVLYDALASQYIGEVRKHGWESVEGLFTSRALPQPAAEDFSELMAWDNPIMHNQVARVAFGRQLALLVAMGLRNDPVATLSGQPESRLDDAVAYLRTQMQLVRTQGLFGAKWV